MEAKELRNTRKLRRPALCWAAEWGLLDLARILLDNGANINACCELGETPLHKTIPQSPWGGAVAAPDQAMIKLLLDHGADVNAATELGKTGLHFAAANGDCSTIKLFLEYENEVDQVGPGQGKTALKHAVDNDHVYAACFLLGKGADVNFRSIHGETPLHWVAMASYPDRELMMPFFKMLIERGADVNAQDDLGKTPLHHLACTDDLATCGFMKLLLDNGADLDRLDSDGKKSFDGLSYTEVIPEFISMLQERGLWQG